VKQIAVSLCALLRLGGISNEQTQSQAKCPFRQPKLSIQVLQLFVFDCDDFSMAVHCQSIVILRKEWSGGKGGMAANRKWR
jgi:hypothetical protein